MADLPEGWESRGKPPTLFRRFEFARYADTRAFLDGLAALTEKTGVHPQNINFGPTYVNVTLDAADGVALTEEDHSLASKINDLNTNKAG